MLTCNLDSNTSDWVIDYGVILNVFEQLGIDYTCGGKSLWHECHRRFLDPQVVLQRLQLEIEDAAFSPINPTHRQSIVGYHTDETGHWVAELACGHFQHVRHDPPWMLRAWVTHASGRQAMLGYRLSCKKCIEQAPRDY